jgi:hypothetical protein
MANSLLEALKNELEKSQSSPTEAEESQYPSNPRNILMEKLGLPRSAGVSAADEKRWAQDFPKMAAEGSVNLGESQFSKLRELMNKPAIAKPVISPSIEALAEELKAGRAMTKLPGKADVERYIDPGVQPKLEPAQEPSEFLRRQMDKKADKIQAERELQEFLDAAKQKSINSGSGEEVTGKIKQKLGE